MPFWLAADQACPQENAWERVWSTEAMQTWAKAFAAERAAAMRLSSQLPPHLLQTGVDGKRRRVECTWHWISRLEKDRANLFVIKEGKKYTNLDAVKSCIDSYRKRIAFVSLAPRVFDAMVAKVRDELKEPKVAAWLAESRDKPFTYFHANDGAYGGSADHALNIEGKNGHIKKVCCMLQHARSTQTH